MEIILVCGYRRTGKDALCKILADDTTPHFPWKVYTHPGLLGQQLINKTNNPMLVKRVAFADALKKESSEEYNIPAFVSDDDKEIKQFTHPKTGELVSARDIYIEWGAIRREQNVDYWCEKALYEINYDNSVANVWLDLGMTKIPHCVYVVTDWRFPNEMHYFNKHSLHPVKTARVFRSEVPIPNMNIDSEHGLDNTTTDYLLVKDDNEFEKACKIFPQYRGYVLNQTI